MCKYKSQAGVSLVEFALLFPLCLVLLFFGTTAIGDYYIRRIQAHNISFTTSFATKVYCSSADFLSQPECLGWIHENWDQYRTAVGIDATNHVALYGTGLTGVMTKMTGVTPDTAEGYTAFSTAAFTGGDPVLTDLANQIEWIATSDVYIKSNTAALDMMFIGEIGYSSFM